MSDEVIKDGPLRGPRKKKEKAPDTRSEAEKEIDAAIAKSSLKERKDAERKKNIKHTMIGLGAVLLALFIYWGLAPFKGNMGYGICKVFLELNVRYPDTLHLSTVEEFETSVRIWYEQTDAFGAVRFEPIQCYYKHDDKTGLALEKVTINRQEVDPKVVADFNHSLPVVFAYKPDLVLPEEIPDSLADMKIETDKFRKQIFGP